MIQIKRAILASVVAAALWTPLANAELITNGGFETGDFSGWSCGPALCGSSDQANVYFSGVSSAFPGAGGYSFLAGASTYATPNDPSGPPSNPIYSSISQTFSTVAGQQYLLTFDYGEYNNNNTIYNPGSGDPNQQFDCSYSGDGCYLNPGNVDYAGNDPTGNPISNPYYQTNYLAVVIDGSSVYSDSDFLAFQHGANQTGQGFFQSHSMVFTATSSSTTLEFETFDMQADVALDNISVNAAEAATPEPGTLVLLGAGLLAGLIYKRRTA